MPSDVMHKLFALAAFAFAGGAMAAEAVLVHDIAPPHPRYKQLTQMAAEVEKRTQGTLTIAINRRRQGCRLESVLRSKPKQTQSTSAVLAPQCVTSNQGKQDNRCRE
jgi:hypothetical protein